MVGQILANFDLYVWIALVLFVAGVVATLIYDNTATLKTKQRRERPSPQPRTKSD